MSQSSAEGVRAVQRHRRPRSLRFSSARMTTMRFTSTRGRAPDVRIQRSPRQQDCAGQVACTCRPNGRSRSKSFMRAICRAWARSSLRRTWSGILWSKLAEIRRMRSTFRRRASLTKRRSAPAYRACRPPSQHSRISVRASSQPAWLARAPSAAADSHGTTSRRRGGVPQSSVWACQSCSRRDSRIVADAGAPAHLLGRKRRLPIRCAARSANCQRMVIKAFADAQLRARMQLFR